MRLNPNNNTSAKRKKAEAHDAGKRVWKSLSWPQSHNKPMISQWLPAFCIAVAFQRLYNYQCWLGQHFLNSCLLLQRPVFTAVSWVFRAASQSDPRCGRLQLCALLLLVLSLTIFSPLRPHYRTVSFFLPSSFSFNPSVLTYSPSWILCERKATHGSAVSALRSDPRSSTESFHISLFFLPLSHLVRREGVVLL